MAKAKGSSRSQSAKGRKSSTKSASSKSSSASASSRSASSGGNGAAGRSGKGAMEMLRADHQSVQKMFKQFRKLCASSSASDSEKEMLAREICSALTIHSQIEEEIFYPAVGEAIDEQHLLHEAEVEHASAKELIRQIGEMDAGDELFDATVTVLGEYINHHIEEEENEIFPAAKQAKVDNKGLGMELRERSQELMEESGTSGRRQGSTRRSSRSASPRREGVRARA